MKENELDGDSSNVVWMFQTVLYPILGEAIALLGVKAPKGQTVILLFFFAKFLWLDVQLNVLSYWGLRCLAAQTGLMGNSWDVLFCSI